MDSEHQPAIASEFPEGYPQEYFGFQAKVGFTKHGGGFNATEELLRLCHVGEGQRVLDVGCGAGITATFIAREHGCTVTGVDVFDQMVARAQERAEQVGVTDRTEFRVADAQDLPFDDGTFDVTLSESVTAFSADKVRNLREYTRVTRPGGYVGLNEATFAEPPTPELIRFVQSAFGPVTEFLSADEWASVMEEAGLGGIVVKVTGLEIGDALSTIKPVGCTGYLRLWLRTLKLVLTDPSSRQFARRSTSIPSRLLTTMKVGLYVGRKPEAA
jgi:SAM-dependent methyltransferase